MITLGRAIPTCRSDERTIIGTEAGPHQRVQFSRGKREDARSDTFAANKRLEARRECPSCGITFRRRAHFEIANRKRHQRFSRYSLRRTHGEKREPAGHQIQFSFFIVDGVKQCYYLSIAISFVKQMRQ